MLMESEIIEGNESILITTPNNFTKGVVNDRYLDKLKVELKQEVQVKEKED